ncbi:MAG: hypothetical protein ACRC1K_10870, partial [Planctomycetia bacterium]
HAVGGAVNALGALNVAAWQAGFPFAVDFRAGHPRYSPGENDGPAGLSRREFDLAVLVGMTAEQYAAVADDLADVDVVWIGDEPPPAEAPRRGKTVILPIARFGRETTGMAYRMDDVPLPLTAVDPGTFPTAEATLTDLRRRLPAG